MLFLLLFLSDTIKNYSPQKEKEKKMKEIYDARHDFQFPPGSQMDTHKNESKKEKKNQLGRGGNTSGELHDQYIIIGCSMAKERTTTNSN